MSVKHILACAVVATAVASAQAGTVQLITNGNFETGSTAGWTAASTGGQKFNAIGNGANVPYSGHAVQVNGAGGNYVAVSDQTGGSGQALLQSFTKAAGVQTALHVDFLNGMRREADIDQVLKATDPATVGLALDTAEFTIAGIDPVKFYEKNHARVKHFHFKDAVTTDAQEEYKGQNADMMLLNAGGRRKWTPRASTPAAACRASPSSRPLTPTSTTAPCRRWAA